MYLIHCTATTSDNVKERWETKLTVLREIRATLRGVVELSFVTESSAERPYAELAMSVVFDSPSGRKVEIPGFWAGGRRWLARFAPEETGAWTWTSVSDDPGLGGKSGAFEVMPYEGDSMLRRRGFLRIHESARGFAYSDGTPFFWLGDTVWAAPAHAELAEWERYLAARREQGYNVAQINALPQWDASGTPLRQPFERREDGSYDLDRPDPRYFETLDAIAAAASEADIVPAIVALWFNYVPGTNLNWDIKVERPFVFDEASAARFGRFLAARFAAYGAVWLVSGDTDFASPETLPVYDAAAKAIAAASPSPPLLTVHMVGGHVTPEAANAKEWLSFHMVQSGHWSKSAQAARRQAQESRALLPPRPVFNGEPCYDEIHMGNVGRTSDRAFVRTVEWVSVLAGGNAGLTYGAHGLWPWHREGHAYEYAMFGEPLPWEKALQLPSGEDAARLAAFLRSLPWWALEPKEDIAADPAPEELASSAAPDGSCAAVYISSPCAVTIPGAVPGAEYEAVWFDPASNRTAAADARLDDGRIVVAPPPWEGDAALRVTRKGS